MIGFLFVKTIAFLFCCFMILEDKSMTAKGNTPLA
jgi:hypothetical protein